MQAVIRIGSSQYLVTPGQELLVTKINTKDQTVRFNEVLLYSNDKETLVGTPFVAGYSVDAQILGTQKGDKIRVFKFKAKSRYRRGIGFRAQLSKLKVVSINTPKAANSESSTAPSPVKADSQAVKKPVRKPRAAKTKK